MKAFHYEIKTHINRLSYITNICCESLRSLLNVIPRSLMVDNGDNEEL